MIGPNPGIRTSSRKWTTNVSTSEQYRAFRIAYDGRSYRGFQRQPDQPTIEGALFAALERLGIDPAGSGYAAAGRTDAGVSAIAQTIALRVPPWLDPCAMNGELPEAIRSWAAVDVSENFHPRYDAVSRRYRYVHHAPGVGVDRLQTACDRLVGTHDFRHLTPENDDTTRRLQEVSVHRADPFLVFEIEAPGFLRHQVRRIVSLVSDVGRGERSLDDLDSILAGESLPGHRGIEPADPRFLILMDVTYDGVTFETDPAASDRAQQTYQRESDAHRGIARVLRTVADGIE